MISILYLIITLLIITVLIMSVWIFKFKQKNRLSFKEIDRDIERAEKILNNIVIRIRRGN